MGDVSYYATLLLLECSAHYAGWVSWTGLEPVHQLTCHRAELLAIGR